MWWVWYLRALGQQVKVSRCFWEGAYVWMRHPTAGLVGWGVYVWCPTAASVSPESLGSCLHVWCHFCILSQNLPNPPITFMWKFGAEAVQGCRMEGTHLSLVSAVHPQAELEVGFSIPHYQKSKHNNSLEGALKAWCQKVLLLCIALLAVIQTLWYQRTP